MPAALFRRGLAFRICAAYGLIFSVGLTGAYGDILINRWAQSRSLVALFSSYAVWLVSTTLLGFFLRWERYTFASAIMIAVIVHTSVAVVADLFYFGGHITKLQWLGFLLGIVAVLLIDAGRSATE